MDMPGFHHTVQRRSSIRKVLERKIIDYRRKLCGASDPRRYYGVYLSQNIVFVHGEGETVGDTGRTRRGLGHTLPWQLASCSAAPGTKL